MKTSSTAHRSGDRWWSNGGLWRIVDGQLYSPGVGNNPLWLLARLPADVQVEFDVRSEGADGDVKWEMFGDGRNHSTGYVFIFGGWHNRESRIAKLDEHALTQEEVRAHSRRRPGLIRGGWKDWTSCSIPFKGRSRAGRQSAIWKSWTRIHFMTVRRRWW